MFGREFVKKGLISPELGRTFHRLFELRQRSDYHSPSEPTRETAEECISEAEIFVSGIISFLTAEKCLDQDID